jgi:hypothetical protein
VGAHAASFRDGSNRLFEIDGRLIRGFDEEAGAVFRQADEIGLLPGLVDSGFLVPFEYVAGSDHRQVEPNAVVIESKRLPFVSQPSEWSFSMLKDAALLTLDVNLRCLDGGFILKDASAFNVTFDGSEPVFMDHGSFSSIGESGIWAAYGQFVDHFLAPLMLEAYAGVPFQPRLRGNVDGIPLREANALLRGSARRRKGVLTHIALRSRLEGSASKLAADDRMQVAATSLPRQSIKATMSKVRALIARMESPLVGTWTNYESRVPYGDEEHEAKLAFVERCAASEGGQLAVDVGANTGTFSRAIAPHFWTTVAADIDPGSIDRLYSRLAEAAADAPVIPLVIDLLNPTPAAGWANTERSNLFDRLDADFSMWLAVLHHLTITGGIPLDRVLDVAARLSRTAVIEFVEPEDDMVRLISSARSADAPAYDRTTFDRAISEHFEVLETTRPKKTRELLYVRSLRMPTP